MHAEFVPRTAWSLFNAFNEVTKTSPPRAQMEGSLRLSSLFRRELSLNRTFARRRRILDGPVFLPTFIGVKIRVDAPVMAWHF